MEKISALKQHEQADETGTVLVRPVWQSNGVERSAGVNHIEYADHHVVLCERPTIDVETLSSLFPHSHCLPLQATQEKTIAQRYGEYSLACFERIQSILRGKLHGNVLVQIVIEDDAERALLAGLSGLLKTATLENPQFVGQLILVSAGMPADELGRLLGDEKSRGLDAVVKYERGTRQVLGWQEVPADGGEPPIAFKEHGVYLMTGGLGGLGVLFAREMLAQTREARVVLTGRSALSAERQALVDELSAHAGRVSYRRLDLGDLDQVNQLVAAVKEEHGRLDGILHSAGMLADNFILKKGSAEFSEVLAPKVTGTFNLDEASRDVELDFFVLFSSFAAAMGNVGQADYAAANGFMDQFAAYRNRQVAAGQRYGRTRSIDWPLWRAGGMSMDRATRAALEKATGMQPLQTATGLQAFYRSLTLPYDQILVLEGDLTQMRVALLSGKPLAPGVPVMTAGERASAPAGVAAQIDRESLVGKTEDYLRKECAETLKLPAQRIDPRAALEKYGIDSILAMKLTTQLEKTFGSLSKTLFFEYQTIHELAEYFSEFHSARLATLFSVTQAGNVPVKPAAVPQSQPSPARSPISRWRASRRSAPPTASQEFETIAIIGLSGRYPEAVDLETYWDNLREGKDCIVEVPKERWDWREYFSEDRTESGHHYSKWGGFIAGVDEFDPLFFNISPKEAKLIDPQERLFLQHAWMAIEDAGYTRARLQQPCEDDLPGQVGVYVGVMYNEYQLFGVEASARGNRMGIVGSAASIANRVSYTLNLHGPSVTLDTMCSSSLTAIHLASQDLKLGRTSLAIAGGVNVSIHPNKYLVLSAGQFISSDGACQSFGEGGDGYIPGEGVGVVVLKRLSEARRDGDHIYGLIRGSALNHGGKTNGSTVPNPQAQATAISRALAESHTDARQVSYIEAHGTGTKLGDPIEIAALNKAFQKYTQDTEFCLIGSAKSNIGHCESAAGIAGLTKVLLQMQHRQIVPSLHSARLNPHIDFAKSPFVVNQTLRPWERPEIDGRTFPRIAGLSSFGAGGSNAHLIIEEYQESVREPIAISPVAILLSARTLEQLQQKAGELLEFVRTRRSRLDLVAMAYTLQVGREAMDERLGFVVSSIEQLEEKLQAYVAGAGDGEDVYQGQVKRNRDALSLFGTDADLQETIEKWIATGKVANLLDLWVKGLELDWSRLYGEATPPRISLPTYPFAKERYWIDVAASTPAVAKVAAAAALHPLLHANTSDLNEQRYSSTFTGGEFFLAGRAGQKVLPSMACLEMARAAIERALPERPAATVLELRDTVWTQPIVVAEERAISVALFANGEAEIEYEIYSRDANAEILHCAGRAVVSHEPAPAAIDLARVKAQIGQGSHERLAHLRLPESVEKSVADYVLHPSLTEGALQAAFGFLGGSSERLPVALESLRILSACTKEMAAWVRTAPDGKLDLDLCDERGNVCAQLRGLTWQLASAAKVERTVVPAASPAMPVARAKIAIAAPPVREIALAPTTIIPAPIERKRPAAISLAAPSAAVGVTTRSAERLSITLPNPTPRGTLHESVRPAASSVHLYDRGDGVFAIEITASAGVAQVLQALERVRQEASLKVLLIRGVECGFERGGLEDYNEAIEQKLYDAIVSSPCPIVAVLPGNTIGAGFLFAALCDFMVCSDDAQYGFTDARRELVPTAPVATLFSERFGDVLAQDLLYISTVSTGKQLRSRGWTCRIVPATQVEASAQELASTLASKSQGALAILKQHLTGRFAGLVASLGRLETAEDATGSPAKKLVSTAKHLRLDTPAENVLAITLNRDSGPQDLIADLVQVFAEIRDSDYKAVVLASDSPEFVTEISEDIVLEVQRLIAESQIPVIAALRGNAKGDAWLVSQFCDASVYCRSGIYTSAHIGESAALTATSAATFAFRFGTDVASEILLTGAEYSAADLQRRVGTVIVADENHVLSTAVRVAESWTTMSRTTLASWKQRTAAILRERAGAASVWESQDETKESPLTETPIALQSQVISATAHPSGIVVVRMEERGAKNMFSDALMAGMSEVFDHIQQTPAYKVVILTGYEQYFASGGTKESLLAIQAGKVKFTDSRIFQVALDCKLPVIAAMQGHGIGAGWSMGLFADIALLSEESRYVSPYMNYGFTPGAGATWSLPQKIGQDLARESLLTGDTYTGSALEARGLLLPVLPRAEIQSTAMVLAEKMARHSRHRLIGLKRRLTAGVHEALEETVRLELAMHDKTFVGQSDTLAQIQSSFYEEVEISPAVAQQPQTPVESASPRMAGDLLPSVTATLRTLLANELQMRENDIDDQTQFVDLGLDSISGVSWIRKINEKYQTSIEATKVYSYPTLTQLSRYVKEEAEAHGTLSIPVAPVEGPPGSAKSTTPELGVVIDRSAGKRMSRRRRAASRFLDDTSAPRPLQPVAIIGMAGQFPQANNVEKFWRNIAEGKNCITQVPDKRWDIRTNYQSGGPVPGKTNSQWLGALDGYDLFDPRFFNISPTEAESMDPQQRLFLEACWHSIENAGYDARALSGSKCGVFVGCAATDYHQVSRQHQLSAHGFTGAASSILASRISYFLNLQGPCVSIDTACSSSLVAMAQACDSLNSGDSDLALAGGVYVMSGPEMHIRTAQAGMLSPEGQCFAFDQRADGFVPGEGVGVIVLKRLADAQRDRDLIYGVIEGWGVNQDGKTNGITAPNPESQTRLEQSVYDKYAIDPETIQLIEAHGTGTKLGDPIEVEGLKAAFKKYTQKKEYCAIGSIKSNIGHCLTAAGIAGVIKLLLALKHKQLPPTVNFEQLNEHIDLADSPFYVNTRLQEWKLDGAPRRLAAISSFGFSGTNAHFVIGEPLPPADVNRPVSVVPPNTQTLIPLSARMPEQLQQKARDLLAFIRKEARSADLGEIAYTLQVGRVAMDERLAFVVSSVEQLAKKLEAYLHGEQGIEDAYQGQVKRHKEALSLFTSDVDLQQTIDKWIEHRRLSRLADLWAKGLELDWSKLYGEVKPQRISLPAYPFAREHYWIDVAATKPAATKPAATKPAASIGSTAAVLHPLLHSNTSDLSEQRFRSTFTGDELFLADYAGQKVLPAVAYLEMARAAIEHALPSRPESAAWELRDTVWSQPVVVSARKQVTISLRADGDEQIGYEIYSGDADQEVVHCQGRAVLSREPAPAGLDLEQLRTQVRQGDVDADSVYASCARMGLVYGPAFRGIAAIHRGNGQLLADLRLPSVVAENASDYVLHPSLMEGALQAAVALTDAGSESNQPRLPFALETLLIAAPCAPEMFAWARYSAGSQAADDVVKLDVDLCDARGNVCVQLRGLSSRRMSMEIAAAAAQDQAIEAFLATPMWQTSDIDKVAGAGAVYVEHHIILCELPAIDARALQSLVPRSQCLSLSANHDDHFALRYSEYALAGFESIRAILQNKPQGRVLVHVVVADDDENALAGLSGLLKTAALENPQLSGQLILVPADTTIGELSRHLQHETTGAPDPLIRYDKGMRQVLRWHEVPADSDTPPIAFKDHGVYLITGGLGGLGLLFAREVLAQTRHGRVVLTGRSVLSGEAQTRLEGLSSQPDRVSYRQVDLGDLEQVERLIAGIKDEHEQLDGILHCAGMNVDNVIIKKGAAEFSEVLAPKVIGTFNIDHASRGIELDFFVLFSSIAGALGNVGQADYAAANGFMDQFASYRDRLVATKQRHGRTRSINWSLWQAGGMRIDRASQELVQQAIGVRPMQTATGLQAFHRSLSSPYAQLLVVEGVRQKMMTYLQKARILEGSLAETAPSVRRETVEAEATVSLSQLQQQIRGILASVLGIEASSIDADEPFVDFGLDSFLGAELVVAVNKKYGTELSHMRLFDYSTVREFSQFLEQEIAKLPRYAARPAVPAVRSPEPAASSLPVLEKMARASRRTMGAQTQSHDKIAIVGMSGRYPKANDLNQYWDNLAEGRNAIVEVPSSRWDVNRYFDADRAKPDKTYSKWLGAVDDVDRFDPLFFRISPQEAEYIDPQHRLFLQESYKAFEDAGYSTATLSNKKCGVYLGISTHDYMALLSRNGVLSAPVTSNSYAIAAARIAYYLNLKGPAISVDTACSSALVAIHLACQAIQSGEIDMALAGGVSLWLTPESYVAMSRAGMFSPIGQCKTFDDSADGIVNGEGVGAVVLKRLKDAQADGDVIYGVILGSGINQDGRTNGITAPSVNSQIELEREIYAKYGIDPESISYIETHGTGTKLGDPIELEALSTVFTEKTSRKNFCALGSVKSNIGHTTSAAGVAGLQKVLLSMQHRTLVPSLNVTKENSRFDFGNSPFYISRETKAWDVAPGAPRRAAVSSFGFSGTNAHLIVEEYVGPVEPAALFPENTPVIVPLSARTPEQLRQKSRDLLEFIRAAQQPVDLASAAYTLQIGREAMEERLGFVVSSVEQLTESLSAYVNGGKSLEGIYQGRVEPGSEGMTIIGRDDDMQETIDKWIARKKLGTLLDLWIRGLSFDWNKLYGEVKPRRVSLPTYPFARERCWIDDANVTTDLVSQFTTDANMRSIEDIINQIDEDAIETGHAVQALKMLV